MRMCLLVVSLAAAIRLVAADMWTSVSLGNVRLGGSLGDRIARTIDGNLMKLDIEKDFLDQFRTKTGKKTFVGTGNLVEALVCFAKYTGDPGKEATFGFSLRIPEWAVGATVSSRTALSGRQGGRALKTV